MDAFFRAGGVEGRPGFEDLDRGRGVAVWEADDGADADGGGGGEELPGEWDAVGFYAGGRDVVGLGEVEALGDVGVGHGGVEEGVVDHFGDLREGDADFGGVRGGGHLLLVRAVEAVWGKRWTGMVKEGREGG